MMTGSQSTVVAAVVGLLMTAAPLSAQSPPQSAAPPLSEALNTAERRTAVNGALARVSDPTMRSAASGPTPTFLLEAGSASKTAAARVGFQFRDWLVDVKLQGLVDGSSGQSVLADLGGLRNKSTVEFGILWTRYPRRVSQRLLDAACVAYASASRHAIGPATCTMRELRAAAAPPAPGGALRDTPAQLADSVVRLLAPQRLFMAGISYKVGPERFAFSSIPTAPATSVRRVNWSMTARAGLVANATLSLGAEYAHDTDYDAGEKRLICVPKGDGVLECVDRVTGAPVRQHRELVRVELRRFLGPRLAVNPRLSVNVKSATVGFEVPVYFLQTDKGGLAGGVTLGWRHSPTAGSAVEVTAFVGRVFGLILR